MIPEQWKSLTGSWAGTNFLRMMPTDPYVPSDSTAVISTAGGGQFLTIAYTWAEQGVPQDGLLLIGEGEVPGHPAAVWTDSWHQGAQWMILRGTIDQAGVARLGSQYAENWAWWITIDPTDPTTLRLGMHNVPPGEQPYPVVEVAYHRVS